MIHILVGGLEQARAQTPARGGLALTEVEWFAPPVLVFHRFRAMSSWDVPCADPNLFNPDWCSVATGSTVSVVVDCELLTSELLTGVLVPGNRPVRVVGAVDFQVRGCRRLSLFDVLVGSVGTTVDLLITDESVIIAHGIRQSGDLLRVVELWSGLACSSRGLESVGFHHACSL